MKQQRGQVFILVLILLAVGTLVIVPVLDYTNTALRSQRISEDTMAEQCVVDSSVEDALLKLLEDLNNPAANYLLGGANIRIDIPRIAASAWNNVAEISVKVDIEPPWLGTDAVNTTYIIRIDMPHMKQLTSIVLPLPEGLTYFESYCKGPDDQKDLNPDAEVNIDNKTVWWGSENPNWVDMIPAPEPTKTWDEGNQMEVVEWNPSFTAEGLRTFILICQVDGDPGWGIHYVEPQFNGVKAPKTAALSSGIYIILVDYQGVTYQVVAAYGPDGFEIISYQIVE